MKVLFLSLFLISFSPLEDWKPIHTRHFELRYPEQIEGLAKRLEPSLEPILERVLEDMGTEFEEKITVVLAPDEKTFFALQGDGVPEWSSGTAYPGRRLIFLRPLDAREIRHRSIENILGHEIAHVVLPYRLDGQRPPRWLDEGIAIYQARELMLDRTNHLLTVALTGRFIPFSALEEGFPRSGNSAAVAYAQSADMVQYIMKEYGMNSFHDLLDRLAETGDMEVATFQALGVPFAKLEGDWRKRVRWHYGFVGLLGGSMFLWFLISVLGIYAYLRKKRRSRLKMRLWEMEEEVGRISDEPRTYH